MLDEYSERWLRMHIPAEARVRLVLGAVVCGFLAGIALSLRLWTGPRLYPFIPILHIALPHFFNALLLGIFFIALGSLLFSRSRWVLVLALLAGTVLITLDYTRLQPWVYQYMLMLGFLVPAWKKRVEKRALRGALGACRIVLAGIYIWSGIQKMNLTFIAGVHPWMAEPVGAFLPEVLVSYTQALGIFVPFFETVIGIVLLTKRFRAWGVIGALAMHSFILFSLGPLGHTFNSVVWPWNITMIALIIFLFWHTTEGAKEIFLPEWIRYKALPSTLFLILPFLSFFGLWDAYLSAKLYSGSTDSGYILLSRKSFAKTPVSLRQIAQLREKNPAIDITKWAYSELNVPPYPEERVYKKIAAELCKTDWGRELTLKIKKSPHPLSGISQEKMFLCSDF